ncbi:MAG: DsrE family protein [Mycobacteriales bacterium]
MTISRFAHLAECDAVAMSRTLLVKVTAGTDAPERCAQAFTVAATAAGSGVTVSLWLTGEATWLAVPGRAEAFDLPHSAPIADLLAAVLAAGSVTACTQCCVRRGLTDDDLLEGVRIAGAASFVEEALADDVQALVY